MCIRDSNPGWNKPDIYDETIKVYLTIIDGVKKAGVNRFLMVGGAGSLFIAPGLRLMDSLPILCCLFSVHSCYYGFSGYCLTVICYVLCKEPLFFCPQLS